MQNLAVQMGLNEGESKDAIEQSLLAAVNLFYRSGLTGNEVIDLIPVKLICEDEKQILEIYHNGLMGLF